MPIICFCEKCGRQFIGKNAWHEHLKRFHYDLDKNNLPICPICKSAFSWNTYFHHVCRRYEKKISDYFK